MVKISFPLSLPYVLELRTLSEIITENANIGHANAVDCTDMAAGKMDCGKAVVQNYFDALEIDEKSCLREERGFTWWGEDLAQRIWSDPPVLRDGTAVWKVHAQTDFLTDFVDTESNLGYLSELASFASLGGGLIRDASRRNRIQLASCLYATEATLPWAKLFFPSTAATQTAEAHLIAKMLPAIAGCSPAYSAHPVAGPARQHRVLNLLGSFVREGKNAPVWTPEEFAETAAELAAETYPISLSESGLTAEFPFRDSTALGEMTTNVEHPSYGHGLLVRLVLPITLSDAEDPQIVLRCNRFEIHSLTPVSHFTGSYYIGEEGFCYSNFFPNLPSFRGAPFLASLIRFMGLRAGWFAEAVGGDDWAEVEHEKKPPAWLN